MDSKVEFLFLNEEDMIKAGVLDADRAVDTIGEVITLLSEGDYLMGGRAHNDHGVQLIFPEKSDIPNFPLADSADRRFMAMRHTLAADFICVVRNGMAQMAEIHTRVCRDPYSWRH